MKLTVLAVLHGPPARPQLRPERHEVIPRHHVYHRPALFELEQPGGHPRVAVAPVRPRHALADVAERPCKPACGRERRRIQDEREARGRPGWFQACGAST